MGKYLQNTHTLESNPGSNDWIIPGSDKKSNSCICILTCYFALAPMAMTKMQAKQVWGMWLACHSQIRKSCSLPCQLLPAWHLVELPCSLPHLQGQLLPGWLSHIPPPARLLQSLSFCSGPRFLWDKWEEDAFGTMWRLKEVLGEPRAGGETFTLPWYRDHPAPCQDSQDDPRYPTEKLHLEQTHQKKLSLRWEAPL